MNNLSPLEAIFFAALEKVPPQERATYLDEACAGDAELRRRVEKMLSAQADAGSFLESPAADVAAPDFAATAAMPPIAERPGTVIGPYKLLEQIGEGGFGVVFMAEQLAPVRRKVALKVIKPGMDTRQVIARFDAERQALAVMDHPNIAQVFEAGATESGRPYFVMELVRGLPITAYCDEHNLPVRERLELFASVCQAIQHAHTKGIIHRDIKPTNVLVTRHDGRPVVKVIDFGVAKAMGQQLTEKTLFTEFAQMVGTPLYMSPEQAELSSVDIDTRSDIYSLGVLLYELLTGTTPVSKEQLTKAGFDEIRRIIREDEPPRPSLRISGSEALPAVAAHRHIEPARLSRLVRGELDWIVMKALEKDRSRRYETANGFAADVERYLNDETVQACPPSAGYRFRRFARRNWIALTTVSLVAVALVLGTAVSTWQAIRATVAGELAQSRLQAVAAAQAATEEQLRRAEQADDRATRQLFDARLAQANALRLSQRVGQRFDSLNAVSDATQLARDLNMPPEHFLQLRNAAIACLALPDLRIAKQWPGWPAGSENLMFDGALKHYARGDRHGDVSIRRVSDDSEVAALPGSGDSVWPIFSHDGKFVALRSSGSVKIWNVGGLDPIAVAELSAADGHGVNFSFDSQQCAASHADGSIRLYDLPCWQVRRRLPGSGPASWLAFHPEGRQLAIARDSVLEVLELDGKHVARLRHPARINHFAWHPDGKSLAAGCDNSRIYLWDVAAPQRPRLVLEAHANNGIVVAFSHAGSLIASRDWDGMLCLWDAHTGQQLIQVPASVLVPGFTLDDRLLAGELRDGQVGLWEVAVGREYRTLRRSSGSHDAMYHNASVRFDGRLLAVGMLGGAGLWDLSSGSELGFLELPGQNCVLFEPSGDLLTTGSAGLLRWPLRSDEGLLRIGPPQRLSIPGAFTRLACSRDGRVIASAQFQGAMVLHADRPEDPVRLGPHDDVRHVAVSPDGQWVATGSFSSAGVKVWDAGSGQLVKDLHADPSGVAFSPNGKWLATTSWSGRLWEVGSWREVPRPRCAGVSAFSPDSTILAIHMDGAVRLVAPDTGREYARLESPRQDGTKYMTFSPDGMQLVTCNDSSRRICVWDLRAIREQLAGMGLDWNRPAYPLAAPDDSPPLQVKIESTQAAPVKPGEDVPQSISHPQ